MSVGASSASAQRQPVPTSIAPTSAMTKTLWPKPNQTYDPYALVQGSGRVLSGDAGEYLRTTTWEQCSEVLAKGGGGHPISCKRHGV